MTLSMVKYQEICIYNFDRGLRELFWSFVWRYETSWILLNPMNKQYEVVYVDNNTNDVICPVSILPYNAQLASTILGFFRPWISLCGRKKLRIRNSCITRRPLYRIKDCEIIYLFGHYQWMRSICCVRCGDLQMFPLLRLHRWWSLVTLGCPRAPKGINILLKFWCSMSETVNSNAITLLIIGRFLPLKFHISINFL